MPQNLRVNLTGAQEHSQAGNDHGEIGGTFLEHRKLGRLEQGIPLKVWQNPGLCAPSTGV